MGKKCVGVVGQLGGVNLIFEDTSEIYERGRE